MMDRPEDVTKATAAVLESFEDDGCMLLELRTTPRVLLPEAEPDSKYDAFMEAIHKAFKLKKNQDNPMLVKLLLSIPWSFSLEQAREIVNLALKYQKRTPSVVGIDISGNPVDSGRFRELIPELQRAKQARLKLSVHFGEVPEQRELLEEQLKLLNPDRIGHATVLTDKVRNEIIARKLPVEACITSNVKTGAVASVEAHPFRALVAEGVPVLISTDDTLVFQTTSSQEYQLALGILGGDRQRLISVVEDGISHTFTSQNDKDVLKARLKAFACQENLRVG